MQAMDSTQKRNPENPGLGNYQAWRRFWLFVAILIVGALTTTVAPAWQHPAMPWVMKFAGLGFIWVAIIGRLWSILYIGGHKSRNVIMTGPYSCMRNPLYFFSTVGALGVGLLTGSLTIGILFAVLCYVAFQIVIRREEKFLSGEFGEPYRAYCAAVPRFFPAPALFTDEPQIEISTKRLYSTLIDGLVFFVAFPLFEIASYLRASGFIPTLASLF